MKKLRDLNSREDRNILNLEMDELAAEAVKEIVSLKALNSPSPRSFSFFDSALLGSPDKTVEMP
jgi:hypothetical protein